MQTAQPQPTVRPPTPTDARSCYYHLAALAGDRLAPPSHAAAVAATLRKEGDAAGTLPCSLPSLRTALLYLSGDATTNKASPRGTGDAARRALCGELSALLGDVATSASVRPVQAIMQAIVARFGNSTDSYEAVIAHRARREAGELLLLLGAQ